MKIAKVRNVKTPVRGTEKSAGIDFFVPEDFGTYSLAPQTDMLIPSGIKANIPEGFMLMAADKSGIVTSYQAAYTAGRTPKPGAFSSVVILGAKIVDEDYQGEIHIHLINIGDSNVIIKSGMKIAQFILVPVLYDDIEEVPEAQLYSSTTSRGKGGFGSTNKSKDV